MTRAAKKLLTQKYPPQLCAPSKSTRRLDASFVRRATQIELAAGISAAAIGSETARLKPVSIPPSGEREGKTATEWRELWASSVCHAERLEILKVMDEQLGNQTVDRSQVRGTLDWKLRLAQDTRASALVARDEAISASRVRQLRMDYVAGRLFKR